MAEKRGPGRPRANRIDWFSISTDLELDEKFLAFCKITGASEGQALLSIITLYKYVARHRAMDGSVAGIPSETLAERCYWTDTSNSNAFTQALQKAGFLDKDLNLTDWFDFQPHAKECKRKYDYRQKLKEQQGKITP